MLAEAMTALHQDDVAVSSDKFAGYCDKLLQKVNTGPAVTGRMLHSELTTLTTL